MKKILSCFVVLFAAVSLYATDPNIYASGLKVYQAPGGDSIDYVLNAQATSVKVLIYGPANATTPVKTIDLTSTPAYLQKGAHRVPIDLSDLASAVYTWAIEAEAASHNDVKSVLPAASDYYYYGPRGVAVDNSTESPYFGRVYVANAYAGQTTKTSYSRYTEQGMYLLEPTFIPINTTAITGNVSWTPHGTSAASDNSDWAPYRMAISDDGYVFICDNGTANGTKTGVYMMDPANPSKTFVNVLGQAGKAAHFHRANSIAVTGSGHNRVLYMIDWTDSIVSYPIGNTFPCTVQGATIVSNLADANIVNGQNSLARDNEGGFWVGQNRGQIDEYPQIAHFNAQGVKDYAVSSTENTEFGIKRATRGGMALNPACDKIVFGGGGTMRVHEISKDNEGHIVLDSLDVLMPTGLGNNIDGFAFDVADNVYVVSASTELLKVFALPKAENKYKTMAPSSQNIALPLTENVYMFTSPAWALASGDTLNKVSANVFEITKTFTETTTYLTFASAVGNDNNDWATVNAARFSAPSTDYGIGDGSIATLTTGQGNNSNSFAIPAGTFTLRVDLVNNKLYVSQHMDALYAFTSVGDVWTLGAGTALTKIGDNVFKGTFDLNADQHIAFSTSTGDGWAQINPGQIGITSSGDYWVSNVLTEAGFTPNNGTNSFYILNSGEYEFVINYITNKFNIKQKSAFFEVTEAGYATYFNGVRGFTMPTGMEGYFFAPDSTEHLYKVYSATDIVPAGTPLVLKAAAGDYVLNLTTGGTKKTVQNKLRGTDVAATTTGPTADSYLFYGLSLAAAPNNTPESVGFYWMAPNGAAFTNGAHKAYLALLENFLAPEFLAPAILFNENNATNIENVEDQEKAVKFIENGQIYIQKNGVVYDAMGRVIR